MCGQQAAPSTSFVDNTIDLPWRNFLNAEFVPKGNSLVFEDTRTSLLHSTGLAERSPHAKNLFDSFIRFDSRPTGL